MNTIAFKIGYWSAITLIIAFTVWIVSFVGIALTSPLFFWTNLSDYIDHIHTNKQFFQNLAYTFMLITGPAYVLLLNGFYDNTDNSKKVLVRISILFALAFAILSSLHYFVQISAVRFNLSSENYEGIEYFLQANPISVTTSIVMLGWSLFLGLSSLFMFPAFSGKNHHKVLKVAFLINGVSCMIAGAGYVFQIDVLTFVFANIVTGGAIMVISIASIKQFGRLISKERGVTNYTKQGQQNT